jgi:hypothetical protein
VSRASRSVDRSADAETMAAPTAIMASSPEECTAQGLAPETATAVGTRDRCLTVASSDGNGDVAEVAAQRHVHVGQPGRSHQDGRRRMRYYRVESRVAMVQLEEAHVGLRGPGNVARASGRAAASTRGGWSCRPAGR